MEFPDRARPAVQQEQGEWRRPEPGLMQKMQGDVGQGDSKMPERVQRGLLGMPVVLLAPILDQGAQIPERAETATLERSILFSERGGGLSPATVRLWFHRLYTSLKMDGCSSHSGRRTFITRAARKVSQAGGSLRDVQELAGHTSLAMTQRYIEGDTEAKRKLVRAPVSQGR